MFLVYDTVYDTKYDKKCHTIYVPKCHTFYETIYKKKCEHYYDKEVRLLQIFPQKHLIQKTDLIYDVGLPPEIGLFCCF